MGSDRKAKDKAVKHVDFSPVTVPSKMMCGGLGRAGIQCPHVCLLEGVNGWDTLWNSVADTAAEGCCYILLMKRDKTAGQDKPDTEHELSAVVSVPEGGVRTVELRFVEPMKITLHLEIDLKKGANLGLLVRGPLDSASQVSLHITSRQDHIDTRFVFRGRLVCHEGSKLECETLGHVGTGASGSSCEYDLKIMQTGRTCSIRTDPRLEVNGKNVIATHGCSVGRVPQSALVYMESRGVGQKEAEELYLKGFLG